MAIFFKSDEGIVELQGEGSLLELCLANNIAINHECEGGASCGTCQIVVVDGLASLPSRNSLEQDMAEDRNFSAKERLACQLNISSKLNFSFIIPESDD